MCRQGPVLGWHGKARQRAPLAQMGVILRARATHAHYARARHAHGADDKPSLPAVASIRPQAGRPRPTFKTAPAPAPSRRAWQDDYRYTSDSVPEPFGVMALRADSTYALSRKNLNCSVPASVVSESGRVAPASLAKPVVWPGLI